MTAKTYDIWFREKWLVNFHERVLQSESDPKLRQIVDEWRGGSVLFHIEELDVPVAAIEGYKEHNLATTERYWEQTDGFGHIKWADSKRRVDKRKLGDWIKKEDGKWEWRDLVPKKKKLEAP